jgi:NDP-sugar pyrophosphorylase family protein
VNPSDVCAVILAGGVAKRFGRVTQVLPKCFLPVSADETLLTRLLDQLNEGGFTSAVVSTSPPWFPVFEALIARYRETCDCRVRVLSNPAHSAGPLAALAAAAGQIAEPRLLLCLPDIFFEENPFPALAAADPDEALCGCRTEGWKSPPASGFLSLAGSEVAALTYQPGARPDAYWPGIALFRRAGPVPLFDPAIPAGAPIETIFAAALARGVRFAFQPCGQFENVNTPDRWRVLLQR